MTTRRIRQLQRELSRLGHPDSRRLKTAELQALVRRDKLRKKFRRAKRGL